jgi:hypothetical protein
MYTRMGWPHAYDGVLPPNVFERIKTFVSRNSCLFVLIFVLDLFYFISGFLRDIKTCCEGI